MKGYSEPSERIEESSKLFVTGVDESGAEFQEQTEICNISETGLAFYLNKAVWVDTHLTIGIVSSKIFGTFHKATAKVVRVQIDATGRQLVAVRFD